MRVSLVRLFFQERRANWFPQNGRYFFQEERIVEEI